MSEKGGGRGGKQGACGAGGVFCVETKRASIARVGLVAEEGGARRPEPPPLSWSALLIVNESRVEAQQESIDHLVAEVGGCAEIWFGDRENVCSAGVGQQRPVYVDEMCTYVDGSSGSLRSTAYYCCCRLTASFGCFGGAGRGAAKRQAGACFAARPARFRALCRRTHSAVLLSLEDVVFALFHACCSS